MKNKKEKIARFVDIRDNSRDSMRSLLRTAQTGVVSGVNSDLPLDEVARAKDFFFIWKSRKPFENNRFLGFLVISLVLYFSFTSTTSFLPISFLIVLIWGIYSSLELDKRKEVYIYEMLGDLSQLGKNRDLYMKGLRVELWGIESEKLRVRLIISTLSLFLLGVYFICNYDDNYQIKILGLCLSIVSSMIFFANNVVITKKVKK